MEIANAIVPISRDQIYPVREVDHATNPPEKSFKGFADSFSKPSDFLKKEFKEDAGFAYDNPRAFSFPGMDFQLNDEFYSSEGDLIIPNKTGTIIDMYI